MGGEGGRKTGGRKQDGYKQEKKSSNITPHPPPPPHEISTCSCPIISISYAFAKATLPTPPQPAISPILNFPNLSNFRPNASCPEIWPVVEILRPASFPQINIHQALSCPTTRHRQHPATPSRPPVSDGTLLKSRHPPIENEQHFLARGAHPVSVAISCTKAWSRFFVRFFIFQIETSQCLAPKRQQSNNRAPKNNPPTKQTRPARHCRARFGEMRPLANNPAAHLSASFHPSNFKIWNVVEHFFCLAISQRPLRITLE